MDTAVLPKMKGAEHPAHTRFWRGMGSWLLAWEIYPLLVFASFLRFYQLAWTEFDADQAMLASLPRMALAHGLIPGTGAFGSIGLANPPGYVYLFLPIAAFTANPLADAIFTALLNVLAVLLTYFFVRRYYGRLAAAAAALLFAVAYQPVHYSRFLWQPNLLPFFTLLFVMALFWGVVERRPGWFAAALPLLAFLLQLHLLTLYLAVPLLLALALAYKTVRWRDVILGVVLSLVLFSTYLVWETGVHFADISILLDAWRQPAHLDSQALRYYLELVGVPATRLAGPQTALALLAPLLRWERWALTGLLLAGFLLAFLGLVRWRVRVMDDSRFPEPAAPSSAKSALPLWQRLWSGWKALAESPQRAGLLILLAWQIAPVLLMSRHSVDLQFHYLLFLFPGPFILIGLSISQLTALAGQLVARSGRLLRLAAPGLAVLLVVVQLFSTGAWMLDSMDGRAPYGASFNTLHDLQAALNEADRLAQARRLRRVYIDTDQYTRSAFTYLAAQMQTPHTVFGGTHCLLLPAPTQGPALMLLGPGDTLDEALLTRFTSATLVGQSARLGGAPFHLYLVPPLTTTPGSASFADTLSADKGQLTDFTWSDPAQQNAQPVHLLPTLWTNLRSWSAADGTSYTYHLIAHAAGGGAGDRSSSVNCGFTSLTPGEKLLVPFSAGSLAQPASLVVSGSSSISQPFEQSYGPFRFLSIRQQVSPPLAFRSSSGGSSIVVPGQV